MKLVDVKHLPYEGIFIVTTSLEGRPTKAKEAPSPHEVRVALLDTNTVTKLQKGYVNLLMYQLSLFATMLEHSL